MFVTADKLCTFRLLIDEREKKERDVEREKKRERDKERERERIREIEREKLNRER